MNGLHIALRTFLVAGALFAGSTACRHGEPSGPPSPPVPIGPDAPPDAPRAASLAAPIRLAVGPR